jgi:hypothetical protein
MQKARIWMNQHPATVGPALVILLVVGMGLVVWESGSLHPPVGIDRPEGGQGGGPAGGAPGGGFAAMLHQHPQAFSLGRFVRTLDEVDQEGKHPLTKPQAAAILQVIRPLQNGANLEEGAAKSALAKLQGLLTPDQRRAVEEAQANGPGGGPPGGSPGPGAGGSPSGPTPSAGSDAPRPFNPLSLQAPPGNERAARRAERLKALTARLEKRAAGS